jgi:large subunit ribosomal protein L13
MIPSGPLGKQQLSNCKIYSGEQHSHEAQQPKKIEFEKFNNKNLKR